MPINFEPKSEADVSNILPEGIYDGKVIDAEETTRKATGAPMISLTVEVRGNGRKAEVRDWLLTDVESMAFKLRHFCRSAALLDKYNTGTLDAADCFGRSVSVKLGVQDDIKYGEQNRISDYVTRTVKTPQPAAESKPTNIRMEPPPVAKSPVGDDIPF